MSHDPLAAIVRAAVSDVAGCVHASITLVDRGELSTPVASDDEVAEIDACQYQAGEGPCLDAATAPDRDAAATVVVHDLARDPRWPAFARAATRRGVCSMVCYQLFAEEEVFGALNLYAPRVRGFTGDDVRLGSLLAAHAATAMAASRREANLRAALDTRDLIGAAKGILMERMKINGGQAFDLLVMASRNTRRKLKDVAEELVATGVFTA